MSEVADHIIGHLNIGFHNDPHDLYSYYKQQWENDDRVTTMPPSPAVKYYYLTGTLDQESARYDYTADVAWADWVPHWASTLEPWQITHRSREVAAAAGMLRLNETNHRLTQLRVHRKDYERIALPRQLAEEAFTLLLQETRSRLTLNFDWIRQYIKAHENSSLGRGIKWFQTYTMNRDDWVNTLEGVRTIVDNILLNPYKWNDAVFYQGMRARSNRITGIRSSYDGLIERTRPIYFHPAFSIWTLFLPNKVGWLRALMTKYIDLIGFRGDVHLPYLEGGTVYAIAAEQFNNGLPFRAYDGKVWDTGLGIILTPVFRPFLLNFQRTPTRPELVEGLQDEQQEGEGLLATGETPTSVLDTWGMLAANRDATGTFVGLGDDWNTWGAKGVPRVWPIEYQPEDTQHGYILGVAFLGKNFTPYEPRFSGARITMDRAGKMQTAPTDGSTLSYTEKRTPVIRALWAQGFGGRFGSRTLYDAILKIRPEDWASGSMFEYIIEHAEYTDADVLTTAKELGLVIT